MRSITETFHEVLKKAKAIGASDIHIGTKTKWKFRVHGRIISIKQLPILAADECEELVRHLVEESGIVSADQREAFFRELRDFDCSYALPGVSRFRVNICRQRGTFSIVLRVIPFDIPSIDSLRLPEAIRQIAFEERGLVLATGVTGSGKSTTLAAIVNEINQSKPCKVVTIEDPIEFLHPEHKASVIQREVGTDTDSFAKALRAALRQDPDVVLVGEMRDRETIDIALKAAETGHLVLSTLHTVDAPKTIQRIVSVFELNEQKTVRLRLGETLKAVISQRLVPRRDAGGRVAVLEIMRHTLSIRDCIENPEKGAAMKDLISSGRNQYGMQTFDQHLMDLFQEGVIDLEIAKAASSSPAEFERNVQFQ